MKRQLTVLSTTIEGRKKFIYFSSTRPDGRHIMNYTDHPEMATEFDNEEQARITIPKIQNPHYREISVEVVVVDQVVKNKSVAR
jgi:hypothetical protein